MGRSLLFTLFLAVTLIAACAGVDVEVGPTEELRFSPETVTGQPGESVNFHFHGASHSVSEATAKLSGPCKTEGSGFDSGLQADGSVYTFAITSQNPTYVYCNPHCGQGMVMIINPGPNDSIESYRSAAIAAVGGNSTSSAAGASTASSKPATAASSTSKTTGSPASSAAGSSSPPASSTTAASNAKGNGAGGVKAHLSLMLWPVLLLLCLFI